MVTGPNLSSAVKIQIVNKQQNEVHDGHVTEKEYAPDLLSLPADPSRMQFIWKKGAMTEVYALEISSNVSEFPYEKKYPSSLTLGELKAWPSII
ncbi:hypothetical protein TELCIR_00181 [Teladorsagia circumcincta]|uniref:Uncharacterized protein n=1 Tax=Teladorsagia circumcincta TaxID=45464 RepID=A0A2G9V5D1_TELCI|nr:hypothetical protein TELCIR_00181 [Teladorsagia circumcincta]